jgi:hypothetical protein
MGKQKIPDSELLEKLRDNQHISYYATAEIVGLSYNTDFINRCHKLERLYKIPAKISTKYGKSKPEPKQPKPIKETTIRPKPEAAEIIKSSVAITRFPFRPNEQVYYEGRLCKVTSVSADKITLRRYSDLSPIMIGMEEYLKNPNILRQIDEKPPIKTTGEAIVLKQAGKEYIKTVEAAETAKDFEPMHIESDTCESEEPGRYEAEEIDRMHCFDFEMDDTTDKVKDFGPLFEPVDYIDEEWGRKLTLREKIGKCVAILFGEVEK